MLKKILGAILDSLLGYLDLWIERERSERARWRARSLEGKLESIEVRRGVELRISRAAPRASPATPATWNEGARRRATIVVPALFLAVALSLCAGCRRTVFVHCDWPVIELPPRPMVPDEPEEWTVRETLLSRYAIMLEVRVDVYNDEAEEHNRGHGHRQP